MKKTIKTLLFMLSFSMFMFLTANCSYAYYCYGSVDASNIKQGNTIGSVQITTNCINVDPSKEFTVEHVYDITTGTRVEQTTSDTFIKDHTYEFLGHLTFKDSYITSDVNESTNSSFHKCFNVIREGEDGTPEINESWVVDNHDDTFTSYFDFALQTINEDGKIKFDAISKTYDEIVGAMVTGDDCKYYSEGLKDTSFVIYIMGQWFPEYLGEGLVQVRGVLPSSIESKDNLDSILYNGINIIDNFIDYNPSAGPSKELFEEAKVKPVYTFVNEDNFNRLYIFAWSNATTGVDFTISPMEIGTRISDIVVASDNIDDALAVFEAAGMQYDEDFLSLNVSKYDETEGKYILVEDTEAVLESDGKYLFEIVYEIGIPFMYGINKVTINGVTINQSADTEHDYFMLNLDGDYELFIGQYVDFSEPAPTSSHSSKKYKATDTKDTVEKITGSGKKGSTRTIIPQEGRKVANVVVTDKDGNKIDVTKNADGTYSFVQPAENVNVEVTYKNREIVLNIGSTEASVDGEREELDVTPVIRNDRTMLPIRFVAENLGAKVEWDEKNPEYVLITRGDIKIEITLGSDVMKVNGKDYKLDSVAFAENDRTYLPVRAVSEALNAIVEWNENEPFVVRIFERQ